MCKLLEDLIREEIVSHVTHHNLLTNKLLTFLDQAATHLVAGGAVDTIYLDYQKAFDTVPHKRLLYKLQAYGICGSTLRWIESFLVGRSQRVAVNGTLSGVREVLSGVPQGSVLGPLLFLLYINNIVDDLECSFLLFADDSKLFKHIKTAEDIASVQRDLQRLEAWSEKWLLKFHPGKCHVLSLGKFDSRTLADDSPTWVGEYSLCGHVLEHT